MKRRAVIVTPDRETPGMSARHCASPMPTAPSQPMSSSDRSYINVIDGRGDGCLRRRLETGLIGDSVAHGEDPDDFCCDVLAEERSGQLLGWAADPIRVVIASDDEERRGGLARNFWGARDEVEFRRDRARVIAPLVCDREASLVGGDDARQA